MENEPGFLLFPDLSDIFRKWAEQEARVGSLDPKIEVKRRLTPKRILKRKIKKIMKIRYEKDIQSKSISEQQSKSSENQTQKQKSDFVTYYNMPQNYKNDVFPIEILPMIKFNEKILPNAMQNSYINKQKLKNTDLLISGVKFVHGLTFKKLQKWDKAIVIYQVDSLKANGSHFGLLLKFGNRIISYDGVHELWPLSYPFKSYHWEEQPNSWSCGYIAMFWAMKILQCGLERWMLEQQPLM